MPPSTRAIRRLTEVLNEEAINTPLPPTPRVAQRERPPLGELIGENEQSAPTLGQLLNTELKPKKPIQRKQPKRNNKENNGRPLQDVVTPEVLEDEYESSSSSAVEEVRRELRSSYLNNTHNNFIAPYLDRRPQTPPSKAVRAARRKLSPNKSSSGRTPRFDPQIHTLPLSPRRDIQDDSFAAMIEDRSPIKAEDGESNTEVQQKVHVASPKASTKIIDRPLPLPRSPYADGEYETRSQPRSPKSDHMKQVETPSKPPVFEDHVEASRSPLKSPRIEDSVEAIDALTEALEELETAIPVVLEDENKLPIKAATESPPAKMVANTTKKRVASNTVPTKSATITGRPGVAKKPATATGPGARKIASVPTKAKPVAAPTTKPTSRVAAISKPPFVPIKSSKTPTRPTFVLPGDAITAKKKAQHEAKLKQEEAEKKAKREFKARPVPSRLSTRKIATPKPTLASQKRKSLAKGADVAPVKKTPTATKTPLRSLAQGPAAVKKANTISKPVVKATLATKTPVKPIVTPRSKTAATTKPCAVPARTAKTTVNNENAPPKPTVSSAAALVAPTKIMSDKEKAEATKKARAAAAERGRQASREWAEAQRKKRSSLTSVSPQAN